MLRRILYVSAVTAGTTALDVRSIVSSSTVWNRRHDLTGLLVASEANFAQVLEGRATAMAAVMDRIRRDAHHHDIHVRVDEPVSRRMFGRWSMICIRRDDLADELRRLHAAPDVVLEDRLLEDLARASRELAGQL